MEANIINVTPAVAKTLLEKNKRNRGLSERKISEYTNAMKKGEWKENGESIIVDKNGVLKDGQHRLWAVLQSNMAFNMVVVTNVDSEVMHTIDIGKNRSLKDILDLNGVKNSTIIAALINKIRPYTEGKYFLKGRLSNTEGLDFYFKHSDGLDALCKIAHRIWARQKIKILGSADIGFYHYVLSGYYENADVNNFLNNVCGVILKESNAASWLHGKLWNARVNKEKFSTKWTLAMIIKSWNLYIEGDPQIKYLSFDINSKVPEINKV